MLVQPEDLLRGRVGVVVGNLGCDEHVQVLKAQQFFHRFLRPRRHRQRTVEAPLHLGEPRFKSGGVRGGLEIRERAVLVQVDGDWSVVLAAIHAGSPHLKSLRRRS
jgi:hypothetical protein